MQQQRAQTLSIWSEMDVQTPVRTATSCELATEPRGTRSTQAAVPGRTGSSPAHECVEIRAARINILRVLPPVGH